MRSLFSFVQKTRSADFWRIANYVLSKSKSVSPPLIKNSVVLSCATDKTTFFAKMFFAIFNIACDI